MPGWPTRPDACTPPPELVKAITGQTDRITNPLDLEVGDDTDTEVELRMCASSGLVRISPEARPPTPAPAPAPRAPKVRLVEPAPGVRRSPGQVFHNYQIRNCLGRRGSTTLWEGIHLHLLRRVTIKFFDPEGRSRKRRALRFLAEARAMATVQHSAVPAIYDFGQDDAGNTYLVMEHMEGETLATRLARGPLPAETALRVAAQIADALVALHDRNILYRDLGPENLFVVRGNRDDVAVKLIDFSAAAASSIPRPPPKMRELIGSPSYMAPERTLPVPPTPAIDIYGLGCLLFELLAGVPPFTGTQTEIIEAHHERSPQPEAHGIAPSVARLIEVMLAKRPHDRPDARTTARWLRDEAVSARPETLRDDDTTRTGHLD